MTRQGTSWLCGSGSLMWIRKVEVFNARSLVRRSLVSNTSTDGLVVNGSALGTDGIHRLLWSVSCLILSPVLYSKERGSLGPTLNSIRFIFSS